MLTKTVHNIILILKDVCNLKKILVWIIAIVCLFFTGCENTKEKFIAEQITMANNLEKGYYYEEALDFLDASMYQDD